MQQENLQGQFYPPSQMAETYKRKSEMMIQFGISSWKKRDREKTY
jgi:hypothetical protein